MLQLEALKDLNPEVLQALLTLPKEKDEPKPDLDNVIRPASLKRKPKQQKALPTGTILDLLAMKEDGKTSLNGLPDGTTIIFSGPPGSGKTITSHNSLINVASAGTKTLLVVGEESYMVDNGRDDLHSRIMKLSAKLEKNYDKVKENYVVIENLFHQNKRWDDFFATYEYLVKEEGIKFVVIDSLNSLDPYNRTIAQNLNQLKTFNTVNGVTCLIISQVKESSSGSVPQGGNQLLHTADVVYHIEDYYLSNKDVMLAWGLDPKKDSKYVRVVSAFKSATTPIYPGKIRVTQSLKTGVLEVHDAHPVGLFPLPERVLLDF